MDKLTNQNQWTWVNFTTKSPSLSRDNSPSVVCHPWWGRNAREEALGARSEQLPGKMRKWENFQILMRLPKWVPFKSTLDSRNNSWWDDPSQPIKLRLRSLRKMRILFCLYKKDAWSRQKVESAGEKNQVKRISQVSFRDHCTPVGWVTFWWWNTSQLLVGVVVLALRGSLLTKIYGCYPPQCHVLPVLPKK